MTNHFQYSNNGRLKTLKIRKIFPFFVLTVFLCISFFSVSGLIPIGNALNTEVEWTKAYGGESTEYGYSVVQAADGGFLIAGQTFSFGAGGGTP